MRLFFAKRTASLLLLVLALGSLASCTPKPTTVDSSKDASTNASASESTEQTTEGESAISDKISANDRTETDSADPQDKKDTPQPIFPALQSGDYCYVSETKNETTHARLTIDASDRVTGDLQGSIHNQKAGYYTSYRQALDGTIDGSNLNLDVATWIEYDRQNAQEVWRVSDDELMVKNTTLTKENCAVVDKVFQNEDGREASDLTNSAASVKTQEVYFDPGKNSTTVSNAVVRDHRDVYLLSAQGGQKMTLSIRSQEDNAVFDVVTPSGIILGDELTRETFVLPHTGEYQVIVGGTQESATYDLEIGIQ